MTCTVTTSHALILRAADFAARRHVNQRRKGVDREPYVNHVIEVAERLAASEHGDDAILIAAGFLHDTIEDTETTAAELEAAFGVEITGLVLEVSDDPMADKAKRKRLQIERVRLKSSRAQLITIADKSANVISIVRAPPVGWSLSRIRDYGRWAEAVVTQISGRDAVLDAGFRAAMAALDQRYGR
jgi:(p)ppGpp synthase/HD superfamily hydrolase